MNCWRCGNDVADTDGLPAPVICCGCFRDNLDGLRSAGLVDKQRKPADADRYHWWCLDANRHKAALLLSAS